MLHFFVNCCVFSLLVNSEVYGLTYFLKERGGIENNIRSCLYSNDKWYTVNSYELCPLSIEDSAPGFGEGVGFLKENFMDGANRVCVYDVLGEKKLIRLNGIGLCPLQQDF